MQEVVKMISSDRNKVCCTRNLQEDVRRCGPSLPSLAPGGAESNVNTQSPTGGSGPHPVLLSGVELSTLCLMDIKCNTSGLCLLLRNVCYLTMLNRLSLYKGIEDNRDSDSDHRPNE